MVSGATGVKDWRYVWVKTWLFKCTVSLSSAVPAGHWGSCLRSMNDVLVKPNILLPFSMFQFLHVYIWLSCLPPDVGEMLHVRDPI